MKALRTQFDDKRLANAVATPTCSSCCCCCCCLATSIASSSLLAQRIAKEGERHKVPNRHLLTVAAALFVPIVGALVYFGFWVINTLLGSCTTSSEYSYYPDNICTNPGASSIIPLLVVAPFLVLSYLYARAHIENPLKRAALVTTLIAIAFVAEFFAGAALILTGVGGIGYLILVPIIVGWISVWYHRHIGKEVDAADTAPSIQGPRPVEQPKEDETSTEEPPQQNTPTAST